MADLAHVMGNDLAFNGAGDLLVSQGIQAGQERVIRRLLTNPGDYIWRVGYGAGLAAFVGQPTDANRILGVARAQMFKERAVAQDPAPQVSIASAPGGIVTLSVRYVDSPTKRPVTFDQKVIA